MAGHLPQLSLEECPPNIRHIFLIKMLKGARYENMVDILNEMDITACKTYAIQEPDPIEIEAVENGGTVKSFTREGETAPHQ